MSDRAIEAYVATGEPLKCAGCFALEGRGVYSWKNLKVAIVTLLVSTYLYYAKC